MTVAPTSRTRALPVAILLVAMLLLLASCQAEAGTPGPTEGVSSDPTPAAVAPIVPGSADPASAAEPSGPDMAGTPASEQPAGSEPAAGTDGDAGPTPIATTADAPPITATLAHDCVALGGEQTVTVVGTPGHQVTVNTRYADGQMGNVHGGLAFAQTIDQDGTFTHTWQVSQEAPVGEATVRAGAQSTTEQGEPVTTSVAFVVADDC